MWRPLHRVFEINSAARARNVADSIVQFENIATHAQYRLPYEMAAQYVTSGTKVLDWGCGNGHFSFFLESLGASITGYSYEPPPRAMAQSPAFHFVPGLPNSPSTLPFADATFDVALSVGVLEHVWELAGDEHASLAELARVLRPGGILLTFHLPNKTGWVEPISHALRPNAHFHKRKFSAAEIRDLWSRSGFDVIDLEPYNALPRNQIRGLPRAVKDSRVFADVYEALDGAVCSLVPGICTNFCVVAQRRSV